MNAREFERLAAEALDALPEEFLRHLENIEVTIEDWPSKSKGARRVHDYGIEAFADPL